MLSRFVEVTSQTIQLLPFLAPRDLVFRLDNDRIVALIACVCTRLDASQHLSSDCKRLVIVGVLLLFHLGHDLLVAFVRLKTFLVRSLKNEAEFPHLIRSKLPLSCCVLVFEDCHIRRFISTAHALYMRR